MKLRCIFCKDNSSDSKSVEHIIPESLGNTEHVLDKGIVCDKCNNYFARKLEKKVLDYPEFKIDRFHMTIPSKRGKMPLINGIIQAKNSSSTISLNKYKNNNMTLTPNENFVLPTRGKFIIPAFSSMQDNFSEEKKSDDIILSRFITKIALEALAYYYHNDKFFFNGLFHKSFDDLRSFARYGSRKIEYSVLIKECYPAGKIFYDETSKEHYNILHEFEFIEEEGCLFFIVIIFGIKYTLTLGEIKRDNNQSKESK